MTRLLILCSFVLSCLAGPLLAQSGEDDRGFLQSLIEDNLSGAGRKVRITGFAGALSSQASLETLTIADNEGVWLRLGDVTLDWTRSALLAGRVEVNRLTAAEITLSRLPEGEAPVTPEDAEATPFALPDLPVSVNIGEISAETLTLGGPVLGEEIRLELFGSLSLGGGEGRAEINVTRLDGRGEIALNAGFDNESRVLALDLTLDEAPGGIAASLLQLPDSPAIALTLKGEAPLSDYAADLRLATDDSERLTGRLTLKSDDSGNTNFNATLDGDLTPLMAQDFRAFFGGQSALALNGTRAPDGALEIDQLSLSAAQLALDGTLALDAAGWPTRFDLKGNIGDGTTPVRLPVAGPPVTLERAAFDARYDAARGDRWRAQLEMTDFTQPEVRLDKATLSGRGTLRRTAPRGVTALAEFDLSGLDLSDPALAEAAGDAIAGHASLDWNDGAPLLLRALRIASGSATLAANGRIEALADGFPVSGTARIEAPNLARFAALSGQNLAGAANATLSGSGSLLGGDFDLTLEADTNDFALGIAQLDPLIGPPGTMSLKATRDTAGTALEQLRIENEYFLGTAQGQINSKSGVLTVSARLDDLGLSDRRLSGPAETQARVGWSAGGDVVLRDLSLEAMGARVTGDATLSPEAPGLPVSGKIRAEVADLARFAAITGQPLEGRINATLDGKGMIETQSFDLMLNATTSGLATGLSQLDGLVASDGSLLIEASQENGEVTLRDLRLAYDAARINASGSGIIAEQSGELVFDAELSDLALIDARLNGPAEARGMIARDSDGAITATGLAARLMGATLNATGTVQPDPDTFAATGTVAAEVDDLARFAALAGQPLRGSLDLSAEGEASESGDALSLTTTLEGRNLATGIAQLDQLIAGRLSLAAEAGRTPERIEISTINLETPQLSLTANGDGAGGPVAIDARLANLGLFAPEFSGPVSAKGTVTLQGPEARRVGLDLDASGPGGTTAALSGDVLDHAQQLDLSASGTLPLALINGFIQPNAINGTAQYDLRVRGTPALGSVSGTVSTQGTRVALPATGLAVDDLSGTATLGQSRVQTDFSARMRDGGRVTVTGPVSLTQGFNGDLAVELAGLVLSDQLIYTTTANGDVSLNGPLTGGARIGGAITLEETNIRIPSGLGPASVSLPDLKHVNESALSRQTREHAGLIKTEEGTPARPYGLDITINAPNRIFVRGRGLDAELGGRLRIAGTTAAVAPDGFFELIRGRIDILGKRLTLTEGRVTMQGSLDPYLRFVAETDAEDVSVQVIVDGLASAPEVTFASDPDLPQEEVVSRLIFGRGLDSISAFQAAQMASAVSTLAGNSNGDVVGKLRSAVGLADLDVSQTEDGGTEVSAGAYISDNVYTEVSADSEGKQKINLNLDLTNSFTVKGSTSNDGDTGVGVFFEKDY
ncbi:translocation/assembly module TamB domain-containing protein [uncultured Roseovarius sp.]|uniref:translocation/assembly module TamB domain-containing protein n=1 Tax=uncultured Roseovarius sp. TaxID=293344 RepID=UPI00261EA041|nr:translocation/assembly module TamB domain-containing protein [uncultured Roseovarius sp.]